MYEKLSDNLKTTEDSLRSRYCLDAVKALVDREYIVSDSKKNCTLTEGTMYHVKVGFRLFLLFLFVNLYYVA